MNLLFRLIYVVVASFFKERLPAGKAKNNLTLYAFPNDLDVNFHMNNGRYLTICDLTRVDFFIRTGLLKVMLKKKWRPIIAEHTMTYKKSINLFDKFQVSMALTHWDEKYFYMTHTFRNNERILAEGTSKGVVLSRQGVITPGDVIASVKLATGA